MLRLDRHQVGTTPGKVTNVNGFATDRRMGVQLSNLGRLCQSFYPRADSRSWKRVLDCYRHSGVTSGQAVIHTEF